MLAFCCGRLTQGKANDNYRINQMTSQYVLLATATPLTHTVHTGFDNQFNNVTHWPELLRDERINATCSSSKTYRCNDQLSIITDFHDGMISRYTFISYLQYDRNRN